MVKATKTSELLIIALTVSAIVLASTTAALFTVSQNISTQGTIRTTPNIGVYSDSQCTQNLTSINWGITDPGTSTTHTVYVKNTGTETMTLQLSVNNWSPADSSDYITVTWDKQNTQLTAGQSITATLTLTIDSDITSITTFSNSVTISGTG
jgi:hypothetical protein